MKTIFCLLALIVISTASTIQMPPSDPQRVGVPQPHRVLFRAARAVEMPESAKESFTERKVAESDTDDMENAETVGFGFHKHIHVSPSYGGYYGGYGGGYGGYYGGYQPYGYNYGYNYPYYY
ncbi:uncharacterized protein LOC131433654 [Malaya genurostris]|uniref:uncharacterized protein LOC131433654 n=1 Tax=Malaya genurostris TaxID=325434 RepID=UPI0026F38720|nr:uncharacterized protein LOC131433654 [Malaya genurostris]